MKKLGWIVPSHKPRKSYIEKLIESFSNFSSDTDLIVIWTYRSDVNEDDKIRKMCELHSIKFLFLEDFYSNADILLFEKTRSIINIKKLFGIMHEYQNYEGLVCTDDELEFYKKFSGTNVVEKFTKSSSFPATNMTKVRSKDNIIEKVISECTKILENEFDRKRIIEVTQQFQLFSWFTDVPYYDCKHIPEFFLKYGFTNYSSLNKVSFFTFEHILYQFYCILNNTHNYYVYNWDYDELGVYNWFECFHMSSTGTQYAKEYQSVYRPSWCSSVKLIEVFTDSFCLFHTDRVELKTSKYYLCKHYIKQIIKTLF